MTSNNDDFNKLVKIGLRTVDRAVQTHMNRLSDRIALREFRTADYEDTVSQIKRRIDDVLNATDINTVRADIITKLSRGY